MHATASGLNRTEHATHDVGEAGEIDLQTRPQRFRGRSSLDGTFSRGYIVSERNPLTRPESGNARFFPQGLFAGARHVRSDQQPTPRA